MMEKPELTILGFSIENGHIMLSAKFNNDAKIYMFEARELAKKYGYEVASYLEAMVELSPAISTKL